MPGHALVVLIGGSGSGKSTFARRRFLATEILSSDGFRAMVADDEADQRATPAAFDLLHRAALHRLRRARLTVIDATNLKRADRRGLLDLARATGRPAIAIIFAVSDALAQERNRLRPNRSVAPAVVAGGAAAARDLANDPGALLREGFRAVHVLRSADEIDRVTVIREGRPRRRAEGDAGPARPVPAAERRAATPNAPPEALSDERPDRAS